MQSAYVAMGLSEQATATASGMDTICGRNRKREKKTLREGELRGGGGGGAGKEGGGGVGDVFLRVLGGLL